MNEVNRSQSRRVYTNKGRASAIRRMKWMEEGDVVRLTLETGNTVRVLRLSREEAQREWDKFVKDNPEVARGRIGYPLKPKRKV